MANTVDILMRLRGQKAVTQGMDQTSRATTRMDKSVSRTSRSTRTLDDNMKKSRRSLKAFSGAMMVGAAAAGYAAFRFGKTAVDQASSVDESLNKNKVVFGQHAKGIEAWSKNSVFNFGAARSEALEWVGNIGNMLKAAGLSEKQNAGWSKSITQLSGDMASFNNASPEETMQALQSGLSGETEPLRKYGVFLSEAKVQAEAYASGIAKQGSELTDAQKIQARYNIIMKQTSHQQGDFKKTSDSLANQQRIVRAAYLNVASALGEKLVPIIAKIIGYVSDLIKAFKENKTWAIIVVAVIVALAAAFVVLAVVAAVMAVGAALVFSGIAAGIGVVVALVAALVVLYHKVPAVRKVLDGLWAVLKNKVWPVMKTVGRIIIAVLVRAFKILWPIVRRVAIILWGVIKVLAKIVVWTAKAAAWVGGKLAAAFRIGAGAAKWIVNAVKNVITWLGKVPGKIGKLAGGAWNGIKTAASSVFNAIKDVIQSVIDKIQSMISSIGDAIGKVQDLANKVDFLGVIPEGGAASGPLDRAAGVTGQPSFVTSARVPQTKPGKVNALDDKQRNRMRGGELVIHNHTHLDGREVAKSVTRHSLTAAARA